MSKYSYGIDSYIKLLELGLSVDQINTLITVMDTSYNNIVTTKEYLHQDIEYYNNLLSDCKNRKLTTSTLETMEKSLQVKYYIKIREIEDDFETSQHDMPEDDVATFSMNSSDTICNLYDNDVVEEYRRYRERLDNNNTILYISQTDQLDKPIIADSIPIIYRQSLLSILIFSILKNINRRLNLSKSTLIHISSINEKFKDWNHVLSEYGDLNVELPYKFISATRLVDKLDANRRLEQAIDDIVLNPNDKNYIINKYKYKH